MKTYAVQVGRLFIGAEHPIHIQSMTDTSTEDVSSTVKQIIQLTDAGSELVRITVPTPKAASVIETIKNQLQHKGYGYVPLVGDFHFNGDLLLKRFPSCAKSLDKYRINPGNAGSGFERILDIAGTAGKPIRIGVNQGSLDQDIFEEFRKKFTSEREAVIEAAIESVIQKSKLALSKGFPKNKIILSMKLSNAVDTIKGYRKLFRRLQEEKIPFPLHLGVTEAGSGQKGVISSTTAMAILLEEGIGDTIRYSLTPKKSSDRIQEVKACQLLLESLELRHFAPKLTSCPGCGRTDTTLFQELHQQVQQFLTKNESRWKSKFPGSERLRIAVMGCVVNGPGESGFADIALSLPGRTEKPVGVVYQNGKKITTLSGRTMGKTFLEILETYVSSRYGKDGGVLS